MQGSEVVSLRFIAKPRDGNKKNWSDKWMVEKLMHAKLVGGERYGNFYIYIRSLIQGTEKKKKWNQSWRNWETENLGNGFGALEGLWNPEKLIANLSDS